MNKISRLITLLFVFALYSCCKDKTDNGTPAEQLPPATEDGENTFGCLVNGEVWLPQGAINVNRLETDYSNGSFTVTARRKNSTVNQGLSLHVEYKFNQADSFIFSIPYDTLPWALYSDLSSSCYFYTDEMHSGQILISKFDSINRVVAGKFSFDANDTVCGGVHITEGRFDLRY